MAPVNDDFANAITISGATGTEAGTNEDATLEAGEVIYDTPALPNGLGYGGGRDVWYNWVCPANGDYTFLVDGVGNNILGGDFTWFLTICTGAAVNALTIVDQLTTYPGSSQVITFTATSGTTYRIAVDGYNGTAPNSGGYDINDTEEGEFTLLWTSVPGATVSGDNIHCSLPTYNGTAYASKTFDSSLAALSSFDVQFDVRWSSFTGQNIVATYGSSGEFFYAQQASGNRLFWIGIEEYDFYDPGDPLARPDGYVYTLAWVIRGNTAPATAFTTDHAESDVWHTVSMRYVSGDEFIVTIDGDDYTVYAPGVLSGSAAELRWGQAAAPFSGSAAAGDYYVRGLTVGTSGVGSTEILDDDASMQGFISWDDVLTTLSGAITRTGTAPSVATDEFLNLYRWFNVNGDAAITTGFSCNGTSSLEIPTTQGAVDRYMGGANGLVGLGDYDRWLYMSFAILFDWATVDAEGGTVRIGGYYETFDLMLAYLVSDTPTTGHIEWGDASPSEMTGSLPDNVWTSVVFGVRHNSSDDSFDSRVVIDGIDFGVVNAPFSVTTDLVENVLLGVEVGSAANVLYDTFTFQMDTLLPDVVCPPVNTLDADMIDQTSMRLNANVNPEGVSSTGYFEYGATGYDNSTTPQALGAGTSPVAINEIITGLQPGTQYQFRAVRNP